MAFTTANLSLYHSFSKMPAQNSTSLGNAINKSGHTVTASEVWAQDIPYYGKMGSLDDVKSKVQPYARKNDMCYITAGADKGKTFQYDGNGNWTDITATLVDGALIKNANDDVVLLYHKGQTLTNLTADNNANTDSANNAARLWAKRNTEGVAIEGTRLIEQFVSPTDKALNGLASVAYAPVIANGSLVSGTNYYDYCFSGTILWATERTASTVIDCFEYVGDKLDTSITNIREEIQDIIGVTMEGVVASVGTNDAATSAGIGVDSTSKTSPKITFTAGSVEAGETKLVSGGAVAAVTNALSDRIAQLEGITHFEVKVVDALPAEADLEANTIYLVKDAASTAGDCYEYVAYFDSTQNKVVAEQIGTTTVDLEGYTTDAEHTALADRVTALDAATTGRVAVVEGKVSTLEGQVETITSTDVTKEGSIAKAIADAKTYAEQQASAAQSGAESTAATKLAEAVEQIGKDIEAAKQAAIASAEVTITAGTGIVVTPEGKGTTFEIAVSDDVATAASVSALSQTVASNKTELEGKITSAQTTLQGSIDGVSGRVTTLETTVPALDSRLTDAEEAITALTGTGETSVDGKIEAAITAAKTEIKGTTDAIAATANSAAQSAEGDTYVSASQTDTKITVSTNIANITSHVDTELIKSGTAVAAAIKAASDAGTGAAAEALAAAQAAQQTANAKISSVTEGTDSSLLTVSTEGTAVTITLDSDVATKTNISETALTGEGESSDKHVKVTLGGTLGNQSVTVTTDDIASAAALQALSDRVTGLHQTPQFSVVVVAGVTDLANWKDAVDGGVKKNTIYLVENTEAADGSYIEFIAYESGETVVTEKIGTTKTDLADYAKTSEVEQAISDAIGALDVTNVGEGAVKVSQTDGKVTSVTVATEALVTDGAIKASVTDANALVKASDALEAIKLAKPENYVASVTGYTAEGAEVTTTQGAAVKVLDGRGTSVTANDLWGTTATMDANGVVTIAHDWVTNPNGTNAWNTSITKVEDNKAYVGDTMWANVQTERIKDGSSMFYNCDALTAFSSDVSSLVDGSGMFQECSQLTTFFSNLSSLVDGVSMFHGCSQLPSWNIDLPSLTNGDSMFCGCYQFTTFSSDLSSLT